MISNKYKFICFRIPKAASSTIRAALINRFSCRKVSVRTDVKALMRNFGKYGLDVDLWEEYFKFSFVRNPWSRMVSRYIYQLRNDYPSVTKEGFHNYVENYNPKGREKMYQYDFLCDKNGNLQTDFIGRVENLQKDFNKALKIIGSRPITLAKLNVTKHKYYKDYYTKDTIELVRKKFKKDIEYFDYEF